MTSDQLALDFLNLGDGRIAYRLRPGSGPTLVFLPGYASDMDGAKAVALDAFAAERGLAMLRFDYSGTGSSGGRFEDGTLELWLEEALAALDQLTSGPLVVIGSSMGGWIGMHIAVRRPARVQALVGIAAAPDFTEWGFTAEQKAELQAKGRVGTTPPELFTAGFWSSGQAMRLLDDPIDVACPVRLVHGEEDEDVPLSVAQRTVRLLRSADVHLLVIKGGGHRLSEPHEIDAILRTVAALLEPAR